VRLLRQIPTRLVSRRGNVYKRFTEFAATIHIELDCEAVLDGGAWMGIAVTRMVRRVVVG
jgi:hypothetical protein